MVNPRPVIGTDGHRGHGSGRQCQNPVCTEQAGPAVVRCPRGHCETGNRRIAVGNRGRNRWNPTPLTNCAAIARVPLPNSPILPILLPLRLRRDTQVVGSMHAAGPAFRNAPVLRPECHALHPEVRQGSSGQGAAVVSRRSAPVQFPLSGVGVCGGLCGITILRCRGFNRSSSVGLGR